MIANPRVPAFRYDPYSKKFTRERYDHALMKRVRQAAIDTARQSIQHPSAAHPNQVWGVILGTLGRQGSLGQLRAITRQLAQCSRPVPFVPILLSEMSPAKLALFGAHVSAFVQTSCPRLSIDWGYAFDRPLLSPYETAVALGAVKGWNESEESAYAMDFYAAGSPWAIARAKATLPEPTI